ncbi:MAG: HAD family phosphatase [Acidobacteria bacterium]|nr:HAD family phosphatase [Acidobacteriota bacterium]MBI3278289.1 HAD family phosphatase [Acidobacteriota bacterium]
MTRLAFYDFDGTLVSSNVVVQYAFFVRNLPSRLRSAVKYGKLLASVPVLIGLDLYSRRLFNQVFYREYRGMSEAWLRSSSERLFEQVIRPTIFPGAKELVESDRREGFTTVLVTGSLDFAVAPVVRHFGFDQAICNSLVYQNGAATGEIARPLVAEAEKVEAMLRLARQCGADPASCKAYSDSMSDVPMLEAVGLPAAVNPGGRLRRLAAERGWPVLNLRNGTHVHNT